MSRRSLLTLIVIIVVIAVCFVTITTAVSYREHVNFDSEQNIDKIFDFDDEPSNLCTGEFMGQLSCNRQTNVRLNTDNKHLELLASINQQAGDSFFLFNGAKLFTKRSSTSGRVTIRARQPTGRFLRTMFSLRTLSSNGIDLDRNHQSCIIFVQQTDTLIYKLYDRNITSSITQSWTKKTRKFKNLQKEYHNYSVEWTSEGVKWFVDNQMIASQTFFDTTTQRLWFLVIQLGVGGPEFAELRNILPQQTLSWPNPVLEIKEIDLSLSDPFQALPWSSSSFSSASCSNSNINNIILIFIVILLFR